jgi:hypothetical protein
LTKSIKKGSLFLGENRLNLSKKGEPMIMLQRVIKLLKNVNLQIRTYVVCLMLTSGRKNCAEMARAVGVSQKRLYSFLAAGKDNSKEIEKHLIEFAKSTRDKKVKRTIVVDPTSLLKRYAQLMEKLCYDRDGCTKHTEKMIVPVCVSVVDENVKIPLNVDFWVQQKARGKKKYRSKVKIAQDLILYSISQGIEFDFVSLDGAFPTPDMFVFFQKTKLRFIMRIPCNRCVVTSDGKTRQLRHISALKLLRNSREKTIKAELYGETYFFTAHKRKKRFGGWETVFLVSNMDLPAKEQVEAFNQRWPQEKINRTSKQKFGMHQCHALALSKQKAHIMAGYLAQAIIEVANIDKQAQSVDEVVNIFRINHFDDLVEVIRKPPKIKSQPRAECIEVSSQNQVQNFYNNAGEFSVLTM